MQRDDRLFAIIGGTVVTAAASVFLVFAGGITGTITNRPDVRVEPIVRQTDVEPEPEPVKPTLPASEPIAVQAGFEGHGSGIAADAVQTVVAGLSAHPQWASWLITDDLLERFVLAVDAVADGYSPTDELGFVADSGRFLVREDEGRLVIAAGTFRRYNLAVEVLTSVDAVHAVELFTELEPAIDEIHRGIAWHRGEFSDRLRQAVDHLLAVEIPTTPIEVERRTRTYAFADDRYERLSGAQRQLLRMGQANAEAVQAKLAEVREAFGWPEPEELGPVSAVDSDETVRMPPALMAELDAGMTVPEASSDNGEAVAAYEPMLSPYDPRVSDQAWIQSPMVLPSAPIVSALP